MTLKNWAELEDFNYWRERWIRSKHASCIGENHFGGLDYTVISEMQVIGHAAFPCNDCKEAGLVDWDSRMVTYIPTTVTVNGSKISGFASPTNSYIFVYRIGGIPANVGEYASIQDGYNFAELGIITRVDYGICFRLYLGETCAIDRLWFAAAIGDYFHTGSTVYLYTANNYFSPNIVIPVPSYIDFRYEEQEEGEPAYTKYPVRILPCEGEYTRQNHHYHVTTATLPSDERVYVEPGIYAFMSYAEPFGGEETETWVRWQNGMARPFWVKHERYKPLYRAVGIDLKHTHHVPANRERDVRSQHLYINNVDKYNGNGELIMSADGSLIGLTEIICQSLHGFDNPQTVCKIYNTSWHKLYEWTPSESLEQMTLDAICNHPSGGIVIARRHSASVWNELHAEVKDTIDIEINDIFARYAAGLYFENHFSSEIPLGSKVRFTDGEYPNKVYLVGASGDQVTQLESEGYQPYTAIVILNASTRQEEVVFNPTVTSYDFDIIISSEFLGKHVSVRYKPQTIGQVGIYKNGSVVWYDLTKSVGTAELGEDTTEGEEVTIEYDKDSQRFQGILKMRAKSITRVKTENGKTLDIADGTHTTIPNPAKDEVFYDHFWEDQTRIVVNGIYNKTKLFVKYEAYEGYITSLVVKDGEVYGFAAESGRLWKISDEGAPTSIELTSDKFLNVPMMADNDNIWWIGESNLLKRYSKTLSQYITKLPNTQNARDVLNDLARVALVSVFVDENDRIFIRPIGKAVGEITQSHLKANFAEDLQADAVGLKFKYKNGTYKIGNVDREPLANYSNEMINDYGWAKHLGDKLWEFRRSDRNDGVLTLTLPYADVTIKPHMLLCYNNKSWVCFSSKIYKPRITEKSVEGNETEVILRPCQTMRM